MSEKTETQQSAAPSAPTVAGGLIIPDLSAVASMQNENMQKMIAAVQATSQGLQDIVAAQRTTLQQTVGNMQGSLNGSVWTGKAGQEAIPNIQSEIDNFNLTVENLSKNADTLTASTSKSFEAISKSMEQSLATIEQVAEKFSSGG
ncbi:hypothetical protein [Sneathiella litorea]|uniref:Uncharacterized protein n=1 Tax=Sneathiella litorea TaxID=2606216 RepID=A0A6L8WDK6_9PROT|nr:hypothetical protein [Sneathiella litorea]MZR32452.1 hypothetical protein [Sneathiella litorea]